MMISNFLKLFTKSTLNQRETVQMYVTNITGADPGFFLGGSALVSCSTSTPINHIVFFGQNTSCIRKPQVISGGGGGDLVCHCLSNVKTYHFPLEVLRAFVSFQHCQK